MDDRLRRLDIDELIERTSLGTPEVRALRAQTPLWVRYLLVAMVLRAQERDRRNP